MFWCRSSWQFGTFLKSWYHCRIPRVVYGLPLFDAAVGIDAKFNEKEEKYDHYVAKCDGQNGVGKLDLQISDTGQRLLDSPTLEGFDCNESSLCALAFPTEYVTRGEGNWVYRQAVQCVPFHPNVGKLQGIPELPFLTEQLELDQAVDLSNPHSVLLQHTVEDVQALTLESHVEDDNEPNSASAVSGVDDRIQRRAMNRSFRLQGEIREKTYDEMDSVQKHRFRTHNYVPSSLGRPF